MATETLEREDVLQDLFDLMANERVKLTVTGEVGNVDAHLEVWEGGVSTGYWRTEGDGIGAETAEEAIAAALRDRKAMGYGS